MVFGLVLTSEEDFATARSTLEESIALFQEAQDTWGYAVALMSLAYSADRNEDRATALALNEQALARFRELGDQYFQSVCLKQRGHLQAKQGDWQEGLAQLRESLELSRELGSPYEIAAVLLRVAEIEQRLGQPARAVRLYYAARNVYDSLGAWHQKEDLKLEKYLASCRDSLGESAFEEAVEQGRTMTMEQAIAYALEAQA
jgi:tetratricopeptide (TPR) repeat protein